MCSLCTFPVNHRKMFGQTKWGEPIVVDDIDQETILLIAMTRTKIYIQIVRCWNQTIYVPLMMVMACPREDGGQDCDDNDALISPQSPELCDQVDNNCNSENNEGFEQDATHFLDADEDGYGNTAFLCEAFEGYKRQTDGTAMIAIPQQPSVLEIQDSIDNDCDQMIDEDISVYYLRRWRWFGNTNSNFFLVKDHL